REPYLEPLTLLAVVAGATQRLKIGMNAVVMGFRDPVNFSRQCASLDVLSEGRLLPVVGVGRGDSPEWSNTGRSAKGRGSRANEALEIITRLWREENVSFEGEHFQVRDATITPRPVQDPLPLWIGGSSPAAIRRTVRFGSGWLAPLESPEQAGQTVAAIKTEARAQDRKIPDDHYGASILYRLEAGTSSPDFGKDQPAEVRERLAKVTVVGDAEAFISRVAEYQSVGVDKFIAIPLAGSEREVLEQTRLLDKEVIPGLSSLTL
ncbi:MAG: LLM class flavin-dependent oxidoreductase, partial [Deltaproteobacteria bacterium]|nr:LLM class flavin-dependent oxidoreductase [Deltaproteobacteria bacterium]